MSKIESPGFVTSGEMMRYFGVGEEKLRAIRKEFNIPDGRKLDWTTVWAAVGLSPVQKKKLWEDLTEALLCPEEVGELIGASPSTINGWCRKHEYPARFPPPIRFGGKTRRWIPLEIRAFRQPTIYGPSAREIARPKASSRKTLQPPGTGIALPITLDLLPLP